MCGRRTVCKHIQSDKTEGVVMPMAIEANIDSIEESQVGTKCHRLLYPIDRANTVANEVHDGHPPMEIEKRVGLPSRNR